MVVFSQFGAIKKIEMFDDEKSAYVYFEDFFGAFNAQSSLQGFYIPQFNVMLSIKWLPNKIEQDQVQDGEQTGEQKPATQMNIDYPSFQPSSIAGVMSPPLMPQVNQGTFAPTS